jgi:mannitol-1-phosphate 5-dehydrogenase
MNKEILIIGAGKIGRGFIGHLFARSGYTIWLVDASADIVKLLNTEKKYRVDLATASADIAEYIEIAGAFTLHDREEVAAIFRRVSLIASSVGAANIESVASYIRDLLIITQRRNILNWLICENATGPAEKIKKVLLHGADAIFEEYVNAHVGLIETQILRTGMPAKAEISASEPLALRMQDWWTLPFDMDAYKGPIPPVTGFAPRPAFSNELKRKLYTFNGTNGPIAYIGWANGFQILHEAALAYPRFIGAIQEECAFGLIHEFNLDEREQREFMALALKKYTDAALADRIQRNANDTRRKLGKEERMVGPALLCIKHGRLPEAYAIAIAAAYYYGGSEDAGTMDVQQTIRQSGIEAAIRKYSGIDETSKLYQLILAAYKSRSFIMPQHHQP